MYLQSLTQSELIQAHTSTETIDAVSFTFASSVIAPSCGSQGTLCSALTVPQKVYVLCTIHLHDYVNRMS